ncbi:site-specific DNA-methyltransferase [Comamonas antarctica]|uniref:DNA-methyltransferase n=1 Tax=Comamonas antarctica TaxID=2743470 RepID=UPI0028E316E4|nr:site-specific DNA-methyltransferase [Comamonas antarctica]
MQYRIEHADCLQALRAMEANSVDSIVTDPPYGLSFMGKKWDYDVPGTEVWAECLRVLKPGGHLLAFAGTRTQHRMAVRIEDAGFEIRDMIAWVYGSGFPKSHNLEGDFEGWGTALKPAVEPITVARKSLIGTVAANVLAHGTGALNINACRVGDEVRFTSFTSLAACYGNSFGAAGTAEARRGTQGPQKQYVGRWPANLIHDGSDEVLAAFPDAPGQLANASTSTAPRNGQHIYGALRRGRGDEPSAESENAGAVGFKMQPGMRRTDSGSAARFFYCAKASRTDRNEGLPNGGAPAVAACATMREREIADWPARNGNHHPTVKPTALMAYLCRLVTPPGGIVLDPFMGSGSTGKAAVLEGFNFIGIEREAEYVEIARGRIAHALGDKAPPNEHPPDCKTPGPESNQLAQRELFHF